jgi:hypothetical protein
MNAAGDLDDPEAFVQAGASLLIAPCRAPFDLAAVERLLSLARKE